MIELDEFSLPLEYYFWGLVQRYAKIFLWELAYFAVFIGILWLRARIGAVVALFWFAIFASVLFAVTAVRTLLSFYNIKSAKLVQKRKFTFDDKMLHTLCEDGSNSNLGWEHIVKATKTDKCYQLYWNHINYVPVLISAFRSEDDKIRFEKEFLGKKLRKYDFPYVATISFLLYTAVVCGLYFFVFSG